MVSTILKVSNSFFNLCCINSLSMSLSCIFLDLFFFEISLICLFFAKKKISELYILIICFSIYVVLMVHFYCIFHLFF